MKRYEVYLARLDPVHGSEMGKTRIAQLNTADAEALRRLISEMYGEP